MVERLFQARKQNPPLHASYVAIIDIAKPTSIPAKDMSSRSLTFCLTRLRGLSRRLIGTLYQRNCAYRDF
jgi:hypothetical protein